MINFDDFSDKFTDVKIVNPHNFIDKRGELIKFYSKELTSILPKADEIFLTTSSKNVIRGIHFQKPPNDLAKFVCCLDGKIVDMFIDLRTESKTFGEFDTLELSSNENKGLLIPQGFGHAYSVISENAKVLYVQSGDYNPYKESGINPLSIDVDWRIEEPIISEKDLNSPPFNKEKKELYV